MNIVVEPAYRTETSKCSLDTNLGVADLEVVLVEIEAGQEVTDVGAGAE